MSGTPLSGTERTRIRRIPDRARTDRRDLDEILDAGLVCHVGLIIDGAPVVIPTGYARAGDILYVHGSTGARSLMQAASGTEICVTVTHLDGIVLARSIFHHSMNYRSAMIYGTARALIADDEKLTGLRALAERLAPGQWDVVRPPNRKELAATAVLCLSLEESSVKMRTGMPVDDNEDYALDVWAGILPVRQVFGAPIPDPALRPGVPVPEHVESRVTVS